MRPLAVAAILWFLTWPLWAQAPAREPDSVSKAVEKKAEHAAEDTDPEKGRKNFNIDALMLYGQYNRIVWEGSITQSFESFTYRLNSNFRRSNDFGFRNSRFYDNEIGFTGDADVTDRWKILPEAEVRNDSYGMFRNPYYSREEKDRVSVRVKNEITPTPSRWTIGAGGLYAVHRLDRTSYGDTAGFTVYRASEFLKTTADLGWEYIVSAANKIRFGSAFQHYRYSSAAYDLDTASELVWNFNLSEYFKFGLGPVYEYNRDGGHFGSGLAEVSTANIKYCSVRASYRYEMIPFAPEQLYFSQRYVRPSYDLAPGKGHRVEVGVRIDADRKSDAAVGLERISLGVSGTYLTNNRARSFFSGPDFVLYPHQMAATQYRAKSDVGIGVRVERGRFEIGGEYEFNGWRASDLITYLPRHRAGGFFRLIVSRFETEFSTSFRGPVETSPFCHVPMGAAVTGSLSFQFRVMESFSLFMRIDNIYNTHYSTVSGYPEQGRTLIGGLHVVI